MNKKRWKKILLKMKENNSNDNIDNNESNFYMLNSDIDLIRNSVQLSSGILINPSDLGIINFENRIIFTKLSKFPELDFFPVQIICADTPNRNVFIKNGDFIPPEKLTKVIF